MGFMGGMGGFGGGMGGMGFGGMGAMGGGMGGMSFGGMMGGGMGGMGMGAFGATPDMGSSSPANAPSVISGVPVVDGAPVSRLSSGGVAGETPARSEPAVPAPGDDLTADPGPLAFPRPSVAPAPAQIQTASPALPRQIQDLAPQYQVDADGIIHMVQNSIDPTIWDSVGGPGTVGAFPHTLDLVVSAPERTHEKIEALMDRLQRMSVPLPSRGGWGLPTVADLGARDAESLDFDGLIDLLTDHVDPHRWEKVGGPASITPEASRAALVISTTQEHHEAITDLLTLLRRSRYAMLRQDRPWERGARDVPLWGPLAEIERRSAPRLAKLPAAEAAELALLAVRRQPAQGRWSVEWGAAGGVQPTSISFARDERRQELEIAGLPCRIEGDGLALAYPELGLVELGPWGESMRQFVDLELPWMPHRTNEELARLFRVSRAPASARRAADGRQDPVVRLRLVPRALPQNAETWLEIGISTADGRLVAWEAHREGKLVSRLRWQPVGEGPDDAQVALESADGKTCAVWRPRPVEKRAERAIPELEAGWPGYVVLDRRAEEAAVDRRVRHSIVALQRLDWTEAVRHLDAAAQEHPVHPLLPLARAWCFEADRSMGRREELVEALRRAASQGRRGPVRFVAERHLAWLGPAERLAVLSSQPPQNRDAVDWSYLAQAEMDVGHEREAAQAVRAALAATRPDARPFEQVRLCVELLLQLGQRDEAAKVATDWAVPVLHVFRTAAPPRDVPSATARNAAQTGTLPMAVEQAALLGELLARFGGRQPAEKLLTEALACAALAPRDRRGLLLRLAEFQEGLPRWKTLLSAAETSRAGTVERQRAMHWLDKELTGAAQADAAAQLAGQTGDAELQWRLRVRQAELTTDAALAAELAWQAHSAGRLPEERLAWACETWNRAGQSQRTVRALERHLRQGRLLKEGMACALAAAYYKAGREQDARRAASGDQNWDDLPGIVPPQPPPVPPSPQRRRRAPSAPARGSAAARVVG
jgi:tetratricopeptide (TPR) repeat protein